MSEEVRELFGLSLHSLQNYRDNRQICGCGEVIRSQFRSLRNLFLPVCARFVRKEKSFINMRYRLPAVTPYLCISET